MNLDIVIPVCNHPELLDHALECLADAELPERTSVYIVDDASTVDMKEVYGKWRPTAKPRLMINYNKTPKGFVGSTNFGARLGQNTHLMLMNSDVFVRPDTIAHLINALEDPSIGIVGPKLLFPDQKWTKNPSGRIQHAGIVFDIYQKPKHRCMGWTPENQRVNHRLALQALTGACLMLKRKTWDSVGGLDPVWGTGTFDDLDLCFKVRLKGQTATYVPEAVAEHVANGSVMDSGRTFPLLQNQNLFLSRYDGKIYWDEWQY